MRKLILILLLCAPAFAGTCGNGYSYSRQFVVPFNQVPNTDQTNFPVSLAFNGAGPFGSIILADLKTVANGGKIQNTANNSLSVSGPADLIFCDAASAGNPLKFEVSQYTASTGSMEAYVMIPTLSHTTNTSYWMFYGNVAVVTSQQDLSLWTTAGFTQVCHLPDGSSLNVNCSTGGTQTNVNTVTASTGISGGGGSFVAASSQGINVGQTFSPTTATTVEIWEKVTAVGSNIAMLDTGNGSSGIFLRDGFGGGTTTPFFGIANGGSTQIRGASTTPPAGQWAHVVGTLSSSVVHTYINGVLADGSVSGGATTVGASASNLQIGRDPAASFFFNGKLDEIRTSTTARSADWIQSSYNTESSPSAFSTMIDPSISGAWVVQYQTCIGLVTNTCAFPQNVVAGNMFLIVSSGGGGQCSGGSLTGFSDTLSSTLSYVTSQNDLSIGGSASCIIRSTFPSSGADTLTITSAGAQSQTSIFEIAGVSAVSVDAVNGAFVSGASNSTGSATATTANSLLVCGAGTGTSSGTSTIVTSFTPATSAALSLNFFNPSNNYGGAAIAQFTGSGSKSCTFGYDSTPGHGGFTIAIFKFTPVASHKLRSAVMY